ncbi:MAG: RAMP superfamily CRISPR-associated protein [Lachnospiraceae bacterium]|nr:RAMP superfamily CRISPR-associated protein [Lachnospiraceae bacterium]
MSTRYLKYTCTNTEPLSIVDLYNSKSDEAAVLSYINGSSVRGAVMNALTRFSAPAGNSSANLLECFKSAFFDGTLRFLNAYPALKEGEHVSMETFPVPKGFYESRKGTGKICHIFDKTDPDMKRAKAGKMAVLKNNQLLYMTPAMGETFKIRLARNQIVPAGKKNSKKEQQLFRGNYLKEGQIFTGYIAVEDSCSEELISALTKVLLSDNLKLGSNRTSGYGSIRMLKTPAFLSERIPFSELSASDRSENETDFNMLCLSGLCMLNEYGEPCGINEKELADALGCSGLEIKKASSSVTHICTFNRTTGGRSPEYPVFEAGSIFKISCSEPPKADALQKIEDRGLGILTGEGLGRVLFIRNIEAVNKKVTCAPALVPPVKETFIPDEDMKRMREICADSILQTRLERVMTDYILNHPFDKGTASKSQRGTINTMCKALRYKPQDACRTFSEYFEHIEQKEASSRVHRTKSSSQKKLKESVMTILETDLFELLHLSEDSICGLEPGEIMEENSRTLFKLHLIEEMIHYANRSEQHPDLQS